MADMFGGEFWDKPETYLSNAPQFYLKGVSTPTLIQDGEMDTDVRVAQAYDFYHALKREDCPVKLIVYPHTGHAPGDPKLMADWMRRNVEWMDRYVRGVEP